MNLCIHPMLRTAIVLIMLAATVRVAFAQSQALTLSQYNQALSAAQSAAVNAASGQSGGNDVPIADMRRIAQAAVRIDSNSLVFVDNRPIIAQMQAAQAGPASSRRAQWYGIADELRNVRSSLSTASIDDGSGNAARNAARSVLWRPEFASEPIVTNSLWNRIGDTIAKILRRIAKMFSFSGGHKAPSWVSVVVPEAILIIISIIAIGLIAYFVVKMVRNRRIAARKNALADSGIALTSEERELVAAHNYSRLRELAEFAAGRSDFRSAFRLTFLATLVYLDSEGAIKLDRSKTNWEYLRTLSDGARLRDPLRPLVREFDRIWYGMEDASQIDYERAASTYESIRRIEADSLARVESAVAEHATDTAETSR